MSVRAAVSAVGLWLYAHSAVADAVIVTRAMKATTIMEAFVEEDGITIELEIGSDDRSALRSLLESDEELPAPIPPECGLSVVADGRRLPGILVEHITRKRIERDEISGEPLPKPGEETVAFVVLHFPLRTRPKTLAIQPPVNDAGYVATDMGFVIYHEGVPVNDFRYLATDETVRLDWEDPFYSAFDRRALNRKYRSPLNVFLYIEPFEVRKELVVRPVDIARFADLDIAPDETIPPGEREALLEKLATFLESRAPVTIDGKTPEPILDRIHFLERGLRMTQVVPPDEPIDATSAIVGAIFVYPIDGIPEEVSLTWDLFDERVTRVPASATDEAGAMPSFLTPDDAELRWVNFLKNVRLPGNLDVDVLRGHIAVPALFVTAALVAFFLVLAAVRRRAWPLAAAAVFVLGVGWFFRSAGSIDIAIPARIRTPSPQDAAPTIHALLHNAYRALDFRDEEVVFDRLAQSLSGDVLERVYLEMRRGLRLENQGGARVRVREVSITDLVPEESETPDTVRYRARWNVTGSVGHWGHTHIRTNAYDAIVTLAELDDRWKIADLEILEEERVIPGQP